jgi:hypothetical protein
MHKNLIGYRRAVTVLYGYRLSLLEGDIDNTWFVTLEINVT